MRVPRTFVFADLSGFTNYTAAQRRRRRRPILLSAFRAIAREVASERGVRIAKWLGDGCMIVAVDHADGVAAALDLDERARHGVRPAGAARRHGQRLLAAVRGRRLHRPGRQPGRPPVRRRGPYEVLMPADQVDELPAGVNAAPTAR